MGYDQDGMAMVYGDGVYYDFEEAGHDKKSRRDFSFFTLMLSKLSYPA